MMHDIFDDYYFTRSIGPMVYCDDWTTPIDEIWCSYVVYRYPKPRRK